MITIEEMAGRLEHAKQTPNGLEARCPSHEDTNASLSVKTGDDGRILLHCHAGCKFADIVAKLGLRTADLMPSTNGHAKSPIVKRYSYHAADGRLVFQVERKANGKFIQRRPDDTGGWIYNLQGVQRVLYRLPEIVKAGTDETIFVVEGEKDADRLASLDLVATTNSGGAGKWKRDYNGALKDRRVAILGDNDDVGRDHVQDVAKSNHGSAASVKVIELDGLLHKGDVSDWLDNGGTVERLRELVADAAEWELTAVNSNNAERPVTNAVVDDKKTVPAPMTDILTALRQRSGDWPRRVDDRLFAYDDGGVYWLGTSAALFGWLATINGRIFWHRSVGCVSKEEFFHELRRTSRRYQSVADMPHEPAAEGHFYACDVPEPGDGAVLRELLDRYCPATTIDADLMKAALMTLAWGGPPGTRPCFVITSDDGRGVGKTIFAETACQVFGGATAISHKEDIGRIKTRLLSPDSLTKRAALLDNVKTLKFSWDDLESLITSTTIGGHRMYAGEATRPNMLTWFVTLNGPSLSTDMSQRAIIIKVTRPPRTGAWHEETVQFIEKNRGRIIADLIGCLRVEPVEMQSFTRWATWERYIVARLPEPSEVQAVIRERQGSVDADAEEADVLECFFAEQLRRLNYDPDTEYVFIPSEIAARWAGWAHNEKMKTVPACRVINQAIDEKRITRLRQNKTSDWGRGFIWSGTSTNPSEATWLDIQERLVKGESQNRVWGYR